EKRELRKILSEIRQCIVDRGVKERLVTDKLLACLGGIKRVFCYVSFGSEISTHGFIEYFIKNREIAVPRTEGGVMKPLKLLSYKTLETDRKGNLLYASLGEGLECDAAVVPMLGFDKNCFRLGYGGGFYDRFLRDYKGRKIGLAFDEQLCESLPVEEFDVPLDIIITPSGEYCGKKK
ncbi:MAG: 5-formyltetrahydrofolate cyclo-ligase, partial [Firmicutes bacterium]|nr:5-formyltetrahydrofolate cyclo-ligase [Bacillota bacterium]